MGTTLELGTEHVQLQAINFPLMPTCFTFSTLLPYFGILNSFGIQEFSWPLLSVFHLEKWTKGAK